jgi:hypothetical protein
MSFSGGKGGSKSSSKQTTDLDPQLKAALYGNVADAQNFAQNTPYRALSGSMIENYRNPYTSAVTDATMRDLERSRQVAQIDNDSAAVRANAFGGSRHGILGAQTNEAYDRNAAGILAGLNEKSYAQALQTAQGENQNAQEWQMQLRQLINQSLGMVPSYGTTTGSQKGSMWNFGFTSPEFKMDPKMLAQAAGGGG